MIRKKGSIDQGITSIIVFFVALILCGIFLMVSSVIGALIADEKTASSVEFDYSKNLMNKNVEISLNSGERKELMVFEWIVLFKKGVIERDVLLEGFREILENDNECVFILVSEDKFPENPTFSSAGSDGLNSFIYSKKNGEVKRWAPSALGPEFGGKQRVYFANSKEVSFSLPDERRFFIKYYYGRCL